MQDVEALADETEPTVADLVAALEDLLTMLRDTGSKKTLQWSWDLERKLHQLHRVIGDRIRR